MRLPISPRILSSILVLLCSALMADGFRPDSDLATGFVNEVATAEIAVFPTIVRTPYISRYSLASRQLVIDFLEKNQLGTARPEDLQFYLGKLQGQSQFVFFQNSMQTIGEQLEKYEEGVDYIMVIEVLFPPSRPGVTEVFGIHVYVLDASGNNAFSFLLNAHHKSFADARLQTSDMKAKGKEKLAIKSTKIAMRALTEQIAKMQECLARSADAEAVVAQAGVLLDFESDLPAGTDGDGIPIGFSTFGDEKSTATIATTTAHPALPSESADNKVLQLDLKATYWVGVLYRVENEAVDRWITHDWSAADGFSFWLYGLNSGTEMYFDVLDNRKTCSMMDDAERYRYAFFDDVAGWRLITVPFKDLARKDINNGAPNDGLGLVNVHGWGLGTLNTGGSRTYYIDDFRLWSGSSTGAPPGGETIRHGLFDETRLSETRSRIILEPDESEGLVVEKVMQLMCECARLTVDRGFDYFNMDERARLAGGRASFRINFYTLPPEGMPVVETWGPIDPTQLTHPLTAAIDAKEFVKACEMLEGQM